VGILEEFVEEGDVEFTEGLADGLAKAQIRIL
jgi:hypothetical protein